MALKEKCFYVNHSGMVTEFMAKLREGLAKRKKERESTNAGVV